jgi:Phage minor capsid protein 2
MALAAAGSTSPPSGVTRATTAQQAAARAGVILAQAELAILAALAKAVLAVLGGMSFLLAALVLRRTITTILAQARTDLGPLLSAAGKDARADVQRVITAELGPLARLLPLVPLPSMSRLSGDLNLAMLTVTASATAELERIVSGIRGMDGPAARVQAQSLLDETDVLTALRDRAGRRWTLPAYGQAAVSGAVARAHLALQMHAYADAGVELVLVVRHAASAPCSKCAPWVGKLLAVTGTGAFGAAGTVAEAVASGLLHPSCKDSLLGWDEGTPVPDDVPHGPGWLAAQERRYRAQQARNSAALAIAQARRQHAMAITPLARTRARRLIRHLGG